MDFPQDTARQFLAASSALTGFSEVELMATGVAGTLWDTLNGIVGAGIAGDFLSACALAFRKSETERDLEAALEKLVMGNPKFGPLARNIISMWYLGQWNALPREWCDAFGGALSDATRIVSSQAYVQSLVWPAFGAHPQGAKPTGFGSWEHPPLVPVNTDLSLP